MNPEVRAKSNPPVHPQSSGAAAYTSQPPIKSDAEEPDDFLLDEDAPEDGASYKSRPQLPQPGTFLRTLDFLMKALDAGDIDVDPEYQREVVWTADRMTGLVNSLMENFYIPPIILNKKPRHTEAGAEPKHTLVCVDGKQRLSSVKAFIKGIIPCNDHRGEKWWFAITAHTPSGRNKKFLPEKDRKAFLDKEFVTFEYADLSQEQEEDLFARVQMGVQLTLAEKMRASTGPWQELARCYVEDYPIIYSLLKDRARAKDFQMTLSCFSQIIEVQHPTAANGIPILRTNHNHLPKLLENTGAVDDGIKSHLASVWNTFQDLIELDPNTFTNTNKQLRGVQTFAPVEMVAVTILISTYSESRNNRLLIGDIQALREALRENFVDLRLNVSVWKLVWDFIDNLEQVRGAVDGNTVDRSLKTKVRPTPRAAPTPVSPPAKRGRPTARTKPATILPGTRNMETERLVATSPTDPRPLKRPRVEPVPSNPSRPSMPSPANSIDPSRSNLSLVDVPNSDIKFIGAVSKPASTQDPRSAYPTAMPTQPVSASPNPSTSAQKPRPIQKPRNTVTAGTGHGESSFITQRTPLADPSEARQNHISQLNSYRAHVAPLGFGSTSQSPSPTTATTPMGSTASRSSFMPTTSDSAFCSLPTRSMAPPPLKTQYTHSPPVRTVPSPVTQPVTTSPFFASDLMRPLSSPSLESLHIVSPPENNATPSIPLAHTSQFNGTPELPSAGTPQYKSIRFQSQAGPASVQVRRVPRPTPTTLPQAQSIQPSARVPPPQSQPKLNPKPRPIAPKPKIAQIDGAIDLTSDDEQDGEDLLALFGAKASLEKSTGNGTGSSRSPYGRMGSSHAALQQNQPYKRAPEVQDLTKDDEPMEYNNPYERRKGQAGGSRFL